MLTLAKFFYRKLEDMVFSLIHWFGKRPLGRQRLLAFHLIILLQELRQVFK